MPVLQTLTIDIGADLTEKSRRNLFTSRCGWSTGGNLIMQDALLQPGGIGITGASITLSIPAQVLYIMTAAPSVQLQVTWSGSPPVTKTFNVNTILLWTDMTDVTNLLLVNNAAAGSTPESVRIMLF